jgi:IS5 family transposase
MLKKLRTYHGRVILDIGRKIEGDSGLEAAFAQLLLLARRVREQQQRQRGPKVYSLHAPEAECIGKGKAHRPYEFGVKVSVRYHHQRRQGRPVRHPCEGAAWQSL